MRRLWYDCPDEDRRWLMLTGFVVAIALVAVLFVVSSDPSSAPQPTTTPLARSSPSNGAGRTTLVPVSPISVPGMCRVWLGPKADTTRTLIYQDSNTPGCRLVYVSVVDAGRIDAGRRPQQAVTVESKPATVAEQRQVLATASGRKRSTAVGQARPLNSGVAVIIPVHEIVIVSAPLGQLDTMLARLQFR
jgi:hypothetical protein